MTLINRTKTELSARKIQKDLQCVQMGLKKLLPRKISQKLLGKKITLVFLGRAESAKLNQQFRNKAYPTDVLSFESPEPFLGELVFCLPVLKEQAKTHEHNLRLEFVYLLIHGILHLLGYEHENSPRQAKKMFAIQDAVFSDFQKKKLVDY